MESNVSEDKYACKYCHSTGRCPSCQGLGLRSKYEADLQVDWVEPCTDCDATGICPACAPVQPLPRRKDAGDRNNV